MINIKNALNALPRSSVTPLEIGSINFTSKHRIVLHEPPLSKFEPYVNPALANEILIKADCVLENDRSTFIKIYCEFEKHHPEDYILLFTDEPQGEMCISVKTWILFLEQHAFISHDLVLFLKNAITIIEQTPFFRYESQNYSLAQLREKNSTQPIYDLDFLPTNLWYGNLNDEQEQLYDQWLTAIEPIANTISRALGTPIFLIEDSEDLGFPKDYYIHRYLVLHSLCTIMPNSDSIKYLMQISGTSNPEAFKQALLDIHLYQSHKQVPYKTELLDIYLEPIGKTLYYSPHNKSKFVTIIFDDINALNQAVALLQMSINSNVLLLVPQDIIAQVQSQNIIHFAKKLLIKSHDEFDHKIACWESSTHSLAIIPHWENNKIRSVSNTLYMLYSYALQHNIPTNWFTYQGYSAYYPMDKNEIYELSKRTKNE